MQTNHNQSPTMPEVLLTPAQTASVLQIKVQTLSKWRMTGKGPRWTRCNSAIRYRPSDVAAYVDGNLSTVTA